MIWPGTNGGNRSDEFVTKEKAELFPKGNAKSLWNADSGVEKLVDEGSPKLETAINFDRSDLEYKRKASSLMVFNTP